MDETNEDLPLNQSMSTQDLIEAIKNHNPGVSYPIVAHPDGRPDWDAWGDDSEGIEWFSAEVVNPHSDTLADWFKKLRDGLAGTMSNGCFVVAIGVRTPTIYGDRVTWA